MDDAVLQLKLHWERLLLYKDYYVLFGLTYYYLLAVCSSVGCLTLEF